MKNSSSTQTPGRPCAVCSLQPSRRTEVDGLIERGIAISVVSTQTGISKASLYRHSNNHGSTVSDEIEAVTYAGTPTAMLARLDEISNDLRTVRRAAVAAGNALAATRAADAETRSLVAMADRLGVEDTDLADALAQLTALAVAIGQASRRNPLVGYAVAERLRVLGDEETARAITDISDNATRTLDTNGATP
jgi:hypothetical protein